MDDYHENDQALTVIAQNQGSLVSVKNFEAKLEMQKQMRKALLNYVKSEMKPGKHFYTLPQAKEGTRPSLSQDGARLLCGIYEVRPAWDIVPTYHDDKHISVMVMCRLINIHSDVELASGGGFCTSRERVFGSGHLPDQYNNVIKRAEKRAYVDAVLRLPMVSEVFNAGEEDAQGARPFELVNTWYRSVPRHNKKSAVQFIFHCAPEAIRGLEEEELRAGLAEIERFRKARIDWDSKTLVADMQKARGVSAKKAVDDLYGGDADARKAKQEVDPELRPEPEQSKEPVDVSNAQAAIVEAIDIRAKLGDSPEGSAMEQAIQDLSMTIDDPESTQHSVDRGVEALMLARKAALRELVGEDVE